MKVETHFVSGFSGYVYHAVLVFFSEPLSNWKLITLYGTLIISSLTMSRTAIWNFFRLGCIFAKLHLVRSGTSRTQKIFPIVCHLTELFLVAGEGNKFIPITWCTVPKTVLRIWGERMSGAWSFEFEWITEVHNYGDENFELWAIETAWKLAFSLHVNSGETQHYYSDLWTSTTAWNNEKLNWTAADKGTKFMFEFPIGPQIKIAYINQDNLKSAG